MKPEARSTRYTLAEIFAEVGRDAAAAIEEHAALGSVRKGDSLFAAGDSPRAVYGVRFGCLKIVRESPDGESVITRLVRPGDVVGLREVCLAAAYARSAVALVDSDVFVLDARVFQDLMLRYSSLGHMFLRLFSKDLVRLEQRLEAKMHTPAHARVAAVIVDLQMLFSQSGSALVHPPVNRRDIAELADVTPETVSRAISELKRSGVLETHGARFRILDRRALEAAAAAVFGEETV